VSRKGKRHRKPSPVICPGAGGESSGPLCCPSASGEESEPRRPTQQARPRAQAPRHPLHLFTLPAPAQLLAAPTEQALPEHKGPAEAAWYIHESWTPGDRKCFPDFPEVHECRPLAWEEAEPQSQGGALASICRTCVRKQLRSLSTHWTKGKFLASIQDATMQESG
jgi:hypothetical protein